MPTYNSMIRIILLTVLVMAGSAIAQPTPDRNESALLDPAAMNILKTMSDYLSSTEQFTFRAEITVEDVLNSGQKLQFERQLLAYVHRPDKVRVEFSGEKGQKRFWYDGSKITLLNIEKNLYARSDAPSRIDETLDFAMETYGIEVPIADLLVSDPYHSFSQNLESAMYVRLDMVRGQKCHHLAFTQASVDWQLWIEDGEKLVPRKLAITYKEDFGQPQYMAVFTEWNLAPRLPDVLFSFDTPPGSAEIEFLSAKEEN